MMQNDYKEQQGPLYHISKNTLEWPLSQKLYGAWVEMHAMHYADNYHECLHSVKVLLKNLRKAMDGISMFLMVKVTIELKHQTQVFSKLLVKN